MNSTVLRAAAIVVMASGMAIAIVHRIGRGRAVQPERSAVQTWEGEGGIIAGAEPGVGPARGGVIRMACERTHNSTGHPSVSEPERP